MGLDFVHKPEQAEANESPDLIEHIDFREAIKLAQEGNNAGRGSNPKVEASPDNAGIASGPMPILELYDSERDEQGKLDSRSGVAGKEEKDAQNGGKPDPGEASSGGDSTVSGSKETPQGIDPGTYEPKPAKVEQEGPF